MFTLETFFDLGARNKHLCFTVPVFDKDTFYGCSTEQGCKIICI